MPENLTRAESGVVSSRWSWWAGGQALDFLICDLRFAIFEQMAKQGSLTF
jgi:hypothetical protein